jgi:hypothetical protein
MESQMDAFVITAESGEYEQHHRWIVGVYLDRGEAERIAEERRVKALADKVAYNNWCNRRSPLYWTEWQADKSGLGVISDEAERRIVSAIGPCPCDGWEADEFEVVAVPIGVAGRYP